MSTEAATQEIRDLEKQIGGLMVKLNKLQKENVGKLVPNYDFATLAGERSLLDFFGDHDKLLVIHNMGQGCRFCTLWADGFNGLLAHLESAMAVVLVSKDSPETQRRFANSRGWRFRLASHGGGNYIQEQSVMDSENNVPGAVVYERQGSDIVKKNDAIFGSGDLYCAMWSLLALGGMDEPEWMPQYRYWQRPDKLDDGGNNIID